MEVNLKYYPTPYYIVFRDKICRNLQLIRSVADASDAKIIMAFKANALWPTFDITKKYGFAATASSTNELKLAREYLTDEVHTYSPAYTEANFPTFLEGSTHITFNSLGQWDVFKDDLQAYNSAHPEKKISAGLRINPRCSVIETDIYNPALPGSRFGVGEELLQNGLPDGIEGLHFHALCESSADDLEKVLDAVETKFPEALRQAKWLNMGGGHLMTREGYDTEKLIKILREFKSKHPHLSLILEPGSAFAWRTGDLKASVVDIVEDRSIKTAILDVSFACHMPDTLEMPYQPIVSEAVAQCHLMPREEIPADDEVLASKIAGKEAFRYRLGGNSCLSGDFLGDYWFDKPLKIGDIITLEDMNHYTTVKTNMFNGISHPAILLAKNQNSDNAQVLREFDYNDYKSRMG